MLNSGRRSAGLTTLTEIVTSYAAVCPLRTIPTKERSWVQKQAKNLITRECGSMVEVSKAIADLELFCKIWQVLQHLISKKVECSAEKYRPHRRTDKHVKNYFVLWTP